MKIRDVPGRKRSFLVSLSSPVTREAWLMRLVHVFVLFLFFVPLFCPIVVRAEPIIEWTKYDNTIPPASDTTNTNSRIGLGTTGKGDENQLSTPFVLKDDSTFTYKMWYSGYIGVNYRIYHVTAPIPPPAGTVFFLR